MNTARLVSILTVAMLVALAGCENSDATISYSRTTPSDEQFAAGADRAPTSQTIYAMARMLIQQGRDAEASTALIRVIRDQPQCLPAYYDLSELYMRNQRPASAARVLAAGLRVAPRDPAMLNDAGMCYLFGQDYDKALEMFTRAAAIAPDDKRCRANMAVALGLLGRDEEALHIYSQVISPAKAHHNLGVLCESRDDPEAARRQYELARALDRSLQGGADASEAR